MITIEQQDAILNGIAAHWYCTPSVWLTTPDYDVRVGHSSKGAAYTCITGYERTTTGLVEVARADLENHRVLDLLPKQLSH
jgi:hypothetical protein